MELVTPFSRPSGWFGPKQLWLQRRRRRNPVNMSSGSDRREDIADIVLLHHRSLGIGAEDSTSPDGRPLGAECRLLVSVYFDMVGYTQLICQDTIGTVARLRFLRSNLIDPSIERYHGSLVHTGGDSLLVVFTDPAEAAQCAIEVQRGILARDVGLASERKQQCIRFRVGIDIGETISEGSNLHGVGVITAVRLQAICPPGGICVSRTIHECIRDRLDEQFEQLGFVDLKNIRSPTEAFVCVPEV
jgi:class 3 adenylate cyclase